MSKAMKGDLDPPPPKENLYVHLNTNGPISACFLSAAPVAGYLESLPGEGSPWQPLKGYPVLKNKNSFNPKL